ncbi:MAG: hypothetical protein V8S95_11895 [Odoribacter sp.]
MKVKNLIRHTSSNSSTSAREKNIHIIFIQSQFDVDNAKSIAKEINGQIIPIDPLTEDWTGEMMKLIKVFETVEQSNH